MSTRKRASDSTFLGEPSGSKRPCLDQNIQEWKGPEGGFAPSSSFMSEDGQREIGKVVELLISPWANNLQRSMESALKAIQQQISSLENGIQKLKEIVELANNHSPHLGRECRANAKSMGENDERNLQLQVRTKVSDPLFTGSKLEGERGDPISVALIDANTGDIIRSGPESSIKLVVVVLHGDFNEDDEDNWAQEEFENHMVATRRQKGLLLTGDLRLTLKGGVGELQDLIFMDNSSWGGGKKFRIGLKVASGYCENTRIREGITNAFRVKEHRGESSKKHHPPQSKDEVWRLEKIAKDGKSHQKLKEAGIHNVEDFRQQLHMDPQRLRKVLGTSITLKNWDCLIAHANTCPDWKPSSDNPVGMGEHAAVFNNDHHLTSLIDDKYWATDQLSSQEKFTGETCSGPMQKNSSQVSEGQIGNLVPVQCNLAPPTCATPVGPEVPRANAGSTVEGHYNGVTAWPSQVQSHKTNCGDAMEYAVDGSAPLAARQPIAAVRLNRQFPQGDHGSTSFRSPQPPSYITAQDAMGPSRGMDASTSGFQCSGTLPRPEGDDVMKYLQFEDADDLTNFWNQ